MASIVRYWLRRQSSSYWRDHNPILRDGEIGLDTSSGIFKLGDGVTKWLSLSGFSGFSGTERAVNAQTGTTYTAVLADAYSWVTLTNAAPITLTIPEDVFPLFTELQFSAEGAGQVTCVGGGSTVLNSAGDHLKSNGPHSVFGFKQLETNVWTGYGDLTS